MCLTMFGTVPRPFRRCKQCVRGCVYMRVCNVCVSARVCLRVCVCASVYNMCVYARVCVNLPLLPSCKRLRNNVSNWKSVGFSQLSVDDSKALILYLLYDCPFITYILISDY